MKYITLIIGLLVAGCGKQEQTDANESTPTTNTNKVNGTTEKPVKELTAEEKVVGTYEAKIGEATMRMVLNEAEGKWEVVNGEIHVEVEDGRILVHRINKDGSLTTIARIGKDGKRRDIPKEDQLTFKKIK